MKHRERIEFRPDYRHFLDVLHNRRPARLPLYEHIISPTVMESILDTPFAAMRDGDNRDLDAFFGHYCHFFKAMTYDVVSFEICVTEILPDGGALCGGKAGPIQNRADFQNYPWDDLPRLYWQHAENVFDRFAQAIPQGMKAVGGIGNGVFEIAEDLVGMEYLPFMQVDYPELYTDLFKKIGDLMLTLWTQFLQQYQDVFVACRFGDDLGFKSSLLTNPRTIRNHILPQYRRIIDVVHNADKPFLWHSCGCIFEVMEEVIALGINAKHSNEDTIAPFSRWINDYGDRIGLLGGFDMDFLCQRNADDIYQAVIQQGIEYRNTAQGYALGSGNSIPDYVPAENYLAMVRAAQAIRKVEVGAHSVG